MIAEALASVTRLRLCGHQMRAYPTTCTKRALHKGCHSNGHLQWTDGRRQ